VILSLSEEEERSGTSEASENKHKDVRSFCSLPFCIEENAKEAARKPNMLIISFREPSACIAKTDIRVYRVTMVNLLFYDSRVLLFTIILLRSAFF
jgi:hypothetical protein